jgi:hypothetical protein
MFPCFFSHCCVGGIYFHNQALAVVFVFRRLQSSTGSGRMERCSRATTTPTQVCKLMLVASGGSLALCSCEQLVKLVSENKHNIPYKLCGKTFLKQGNNSE